MSRLQKRETESAQTGKKTQEILPKSNNVETISREYKGMPERGTQAKNRNWSWISHASTERKERGMHLNLRI